MNALARQWMNWLKIKVFMMKLRIGTAEDRSSMSSCLLTAADEIMGALQNESG